MADLSQFTPSEKLLLGGWKDKTPDTALLNNIKARVAMPTLYTQARPLAQARAKAELVQAFAMAAKESRAKLGKAPQTLDQLASFWPPKKAALRALKDFCVAAECSTCAETPIENLPLEDSKCTSAPSDDSHSSSTSSSSSESSNSEPSTDQVEWILSKGACGRLHIADLLEGDGRTACGRCLARPQIGTSIQLALSTDKQWSPRCFKLLKDADRSEWISARHVQE